MRNFQPWDSQFAAQKTIKNKVKRTQEEAEKEMLEILQNLEADGIWPQLCGCWLFSVPHGVG